MKHLAALASCAFAILASAAQPIDNDSIANDSIMNLRLGEVVVEGRTERLGTEISTFIPSARQKNAAQNAVDLLDRMAIPQLGPSKGDGVTTAAGKEVAIYIDFQPATSQDITGMRTADVKRVEYYEFPSDPRFRGAPHVVNFIMQKYEYGGYVKPYLERCLLAGSAQWALFNRFQYRRMTFDLSLDGFYQRQTHNGYDQTETYRLRRPDGRFADFERRSATTDGLMRRNSHYVFARATYSSDRLTLENNVLLNDDSRPRNSQSGTVAYTPEVYPESAFSSASTSRKRSVVYNGDLFYNFNDANTLNFFPSFTYAYTRTADLYDENPDRPISNAARDHSYEIFAPLLFSHNFGDWGELSIPAHVFYFRSRTHYTGTAIDADNSAQTNISAGARYTLRRGKFYGYLGAGFNWNRLTYLSQSDATTRPWFDFNLQYSPNDRHTASLEYHGMTSSPSSNATSANVIQKDPFMAITGNPDLKPYKSHDITISYSFIPNRRLTLSAFVYSWLVDDRYVYEYRPTDTGILRTVREASGLFARLNFGLSGSLRLLDNKLQVSAGLRYGNLWSGEPFNLHRDYLMYYATANYYLGKWNFGACYYSKSGYSDGFASGGWIVSAPMSYVSVGWSGSNLKVNCRVLNLTNWNWRGNLTEIHSPYYTSLRRSYSDSEHCFVKLTLSYTFAFGRPVDRASDSHPTTSSASTGILQ